MLLSVPGGFVCPGTYFRVEKTPFTVPERPDTFYYTRTSFYCTRTSIYCTRTSRHFFWYQNVLLLYQNVLLPYQNIPTLWTCTAGGGGSWRPCVPAVAACSCCCAAGGCARVCRGIEPAWLWQLKCQPRGDWWGRGWRWRWI